MKTGQDEQSKVIRKNSKSKIYTEICDKSYLSKSGYTVGLEAFRMVVLFQ